MTTPNPITSFRSCTRRLRAIVVAAALLAVCAYAPASSLAAERAAQFLVTCVDSHRSHDDPIVNPSDHTGHLHEFTGSWSTAADSTDGSMRASGMTCDREGDTAGYWTPVLLNPKGQIVRKRYSAAYYVDGFADRADIKPFPAGLKIIADFSNPAALRHGSGWHCGYAIRDPERSVKTIPPSGCKVHEGKGGIYGKITLLQARIAFPDCWDGVNTDSPDHRSHMAYSDEKEQCPPGWVRVPRLRIQNVYDTHGGSGFRLSSGAASTMHADFWNTWDQRILEHLVKFCINGTQPDPSGQCEEGTRRYENPNFPNPTNPGEAPFKWPPPAAEDKPRIALRDIATRDKVSGRIMIKAEPIENVAISRVEFIVDGEPQPVLNSSTPINNTPAFVASDAPYVLPLDTTCLKNGEHTIDAEAVGITGRRGHPVPQITIITNNPSLTPPERCADPDHEMSGPGIPGGGMPVGGMPGGGGMPGADMTPPAAPANLTAAPVSGSPTTIRLTWAASIDSDVSRYNVLRNGTPVIGQSTQTTYSDTGLAPNRTYTYTVQAVDAAGNPSVDSNTASASTSGSDSGAPTVSISGPGSDEASGEIRFTAEASDPPETTNGANISMVEFRVGGDLRRTDTSAPYTFDLDTKDLPNGVRMVSARAYDTAKPTPNEGTATTSVDVLNSDETKPRPPRDLKATALSSTMVVLSWSKSTDLGINATGIKFYDVLRNGKVVDRNGCTRSAPDKAECTSTTYTDTGLSAKTRYKYTVQAVDGSDNRSSSSRSKSVTTK